MARTILPARDFTAEPGRRAGSRSPPAGWGWLLTASLAATLAAAHAQASEGEGSQLNANGLDASRNLDPSGLSASRPSRRRTPRGFLYPYPYQPPPYQKLGGIAYRGSIELGYLDGRGERDETRFGVAADLSRGFLVRDFEFDLRPVGGAGFASFEGGAVGRDDQFYRGELGVFGLVRVRGFFDSIPHPYANDARLLFDGAGTSRLTLPLGVSAGNSSPAQIEAQLVPHRVSVKREHAGVGLRLTPTSALEFFAHYRRQHRKGTRPFGGSLGPTFLGPGGGSTIETLEPVDANTHAWTAGLAYAGTPVQLGLAYRGSAYENQHRALTWENPFSGAPFPDIIRGRAALPPDNRWHNLKGDLAVSLPGNAHFSATAAWGRMRQNQRLLAPTLNPDLPGWTDPATSLSRQRADARIDTLLVSSKLRLSPWRPLSLQLRFRYFRRDSATDYTAFNPDLGQFGYIAEDGGAGVQSRYAAVPFGFARWSLEGSARWRFGRRFQVRVEHTHEVMNRDNRARRITREDRSRLTVSSRGIGAATARIAYEFRHRGGSRYDAARDLSFYAPGPPARTGLPVGPGRSLTEFRQLDLADLDQHQVDIRGNWSLGESADIALTGRFRDVDHGARYGVRYERSGGFDLEASNQPSPRLDLHVFGGFQWRLRRLEAIASVGSSQTDFSAGGPVFPLSNAWSLGSELWTVSLGAGLRAQPHPHVELRADYTYHRSREELEYAAASANALAHPTLDRSALGASFPALRFDDHVLDLSARFRIAAGLTARISYRLQHSRVDDFQQRGLVPLMGSSLFLGHMDRSFRAHVIGLTAILRFPDPSLRRQADRPTPGPNAARNPPQEIRTRAAVLR